MMLRSARTIGLFVGLAALAGCGGDDKGNTSEPAAQTGEAKDAAGEKTIASGLGETPRFAALAKAAGLDQTLAGPGPYTVLVPVDEAFAKVPAAQSAQWSKPEGRGQATQLLTHHILPGTVLAQDIGKAIDNGKGKTALMTMGGGTLSATREGDKIVLTDPNGGKAMIAHGDVRYSNGVIHHIDGVLAPPKS
jgi:uncharacterized surface protein with fasciclin (FAS1) repeats